MGEATHETGESTPTRDALLRETYRLNHEIGYIGFRDEFFNDPRAIKEWPDPAVRERELRGFWDSEGSLASFRQGHAHESVEQLTAYRDRLRDLLSADKGTQIAHYNRLAELGRSERLLEEGIRAEAGNTSLPSSAAIEDDLDAMPTAEELKKLYAEWEEDYAARRAEDEQRRLPSPSQIIADPAPYLPEPQAGHGKDQER